MNKNVDKMEKKIFYYSCNLTVSIKSINQFQIFFPNEVFLLQFDTVAFGSVNTATTTAQIVARIQ